MTPNRQGLIAAPEVNRLAELGAYNRQRFSVPLAETASEGLWHEGMALELSWEKPARVEMVLLEEDISNGQRVAKYRLEVKEGGVWRPLVEGSTIGRKRVEAFTPVETTGVRLRILESAPLPKICRFAAFHRTLPGQMMPRNLQ